MQQNATAARAPRSAPNHAGELTALPQTSSWFKGAISGGKGKGGDEKVRNGTGRH